MLKTGVRGTGGKPECQFGGSAAMVKSEDEVCPTCGAKMIPIVYGYPTVELFEAAERGEVFLGGCCIMDYNPAFACSCSEIRIEAPRITTKTPPSRRPRA